jgi:hypothetical protein
MGSANDKEGRKKWTGFYPCEAEQTHKEPISVPVCWRSVIGGGEGYFIDDIQVKRCAEHGSSTSDYVWFSFYPNKPMPKGDISDWTDEDEKEWEKDDIGRKF